MTRRTLVWAVVAAVVLIIELGATIGAVVGAPFSPVSGWGHTRPIDVLTFVTVVAGCSVLALFDRFPITTAVIATASYVVFALRDHELGMFLPPMIVIFGVAALTRQRVVAILCALVSLAAAVVWVAHRADRIVDPGVSLMVWVAFGTVLASFFLGPLLVGEVVRTRSLLREARSTAQAAREG